MFVVGDWIKSDSGAQRDFRDALGCFATGVAVVTAVSADGEKLGITVNSFSSVSLAPPLVLFSIAKDAYSAEALIGAGRFAVNLLSDDQELLSARFSQALSDKWEDIEHFLTDGGCPCFAKSLAVFDCVLKDCYEGGDHTIVLGEVKSFSYNEDGRPLLFYRGSYRTIF